MFGILSLDLPVGILKNQLSAFCYSIKLIEKIMAYLQSQVIDLFPGNYVKCVLTKEGTDKWQQNKLLCFLKS